MNTREFINAIKSHVADAAIDDAIANLKNPSGRRVPPSVKKGSDWYNALPVEDAEKLIALFYRQSIPRYLAFLQCWMGLEQ